MAKILYNKFRRQKYFLVKTKATLLIFGNVRKRRKNAYKLKDKHAEREDQE